MKRSQFGWMWYYETDRAAFIIDLTSWGVRIKVGASWEAQVLCFVVATV